MYQCVPNLENRIISLTLSQALSDKRFSRFLRFIIAQRMGLLTTSFGPVKIGFWKACVARVLEGGGSGLLHPVRGLKHSL